MGRPSKVTKRTKVALVRQFHTGKLLTLHQGQQFVRSMDGVQIHVKSLRNILNQEGLKAYVQRSKSDLTKDQIAARYKFAKDHLKWTVDDWKNVMFSDETMVSRIGTFGRKFYYRRPGNKRILPHQIQKTKQGGGGKIMIWGCMTFYGVGDACWLKEMVNSETYVDVLQEYVLASRDWYDMDPRTFIFQQDNARVHTAAIVKRFFQGFNIKVMEWPPNSPDLNLIENLWSHLKYRLSQYNDTPGSIEELWERIQDIWTNTDIDFLHELYESMPRRIRMLYKNKGGYTDY